MKLADELGFAGKVVKEHLAKFKYMEPENEKDASFLAAFWHVFFNDLLNDILEGDTSETLWIQQRIGHLLGRCDKWCLYCGDYSDEI